MVQRLREGAHLGLVHGNGEYLTKHHAVLLGARAHPRGYVGHEGLVTSSRIGGARIVERGEGRAVIETFTVEYDRAGHPVKGFVIGRFEDGSRVLANTAEGDGATLAALVDTGTEAVGRTGLVFPHADGRNLFRMASERTRRSLKAPASMPPRPRTSTSRGLAPSAGPTTPSRSMRSIMRAARL